MQKRDAPWDVKVTLNRTDRDWPKLLPNEKPRVETEMLALLTEKKVVVDRVSVVQPVETQRTFFVRFHDPSKVQLASNRAESGRIRRSSKCDERDLIQYKKL